MIVIEVQSGMVKMYGGHPELDVVVVDHSVEGPPGAFRCASLPLADLNKETKALVTRVGEDL